MKFPIVTRSHHDEVVSLLRAQLERVDLERRAYLDRLATAGLGGAFFSVPAAGAAQEEENTPEPEMTVEERIRAFRRRPSRMASFVTREFRKNLERQAAEDGRAPHIRKEVDDELDAAEQAGRRQSA
ncbi:MAG: hypothetical protein ACJ71S_06585 [Acidobacteriaceae bacterium]|jgi:hypothetical protein